MKSLRVVILQDEAILGILSKMLESLKNVRGEKLIFLNNPCELVELIRTGDRLFVVSGQRGFDLALDVKTHNPESFFFSYSSDLEMGPHFDGRVSKLEPGHFWHVLGFIALACQLEQLPSAEIKAEIGKLSFVELNQNPA